jgi:hypothetical protein
MPPIDVSPGGIHPLEDIRTLLPLVCDRMGYSQDRITKPLYDRIAALIAQGLTAVSPDFILRTAAVIKWEAGRIEGEEVMIESKKWAGLLNRMESPTFLCCFMVTVGENLDRMIDGRSSENRLFDGFVMDALGAVMVENLADQMEENIKKALAAKGYEGSRRFSPGYCDWGLQSGQKALCRFLCPEKIGVKCLDTGAMIPTKSVSAVVVGAKKIPWNSPCRFCSEIHCPYRREAETATR